MKFDTTKPLEANEISADLSDDEEIESLDTQLDQLHNALDTLEQKNDSIKERLQELLRYVKLNREHLNEVESSLGEGSEESAAELSSLREQLSQMESNSAMLPVVADVSSLREQLNQLEVNVACAAANLGNLTQSAPEVRENTEG